MLRGTPAAEDAEPLGGRPDWAVVSAYRSRVLLAALGLLAAGIAPAIFPSAATAEGMSPEHERRIMVDSQIAERGIRNPDVLEAVRKVPRHRFVPESLQRSAYEDRPLPIGHGQSHW